MLNKSEVITWQAQVVFQILSIKVVKWNSGKLINIHRRGLFQLLLFKYFYKTADKANLFTF